MSLVDGDWITPGGDTEASTANQEIEITYPALTLFGVGSISTMKRSYDNIYIHRHPSEN